MAVIETLGTYGLQTNAGDGGLEITLNADSSIETAVFRDSSVVTLADYPGLTPLQTEANDDGGFTIVWQNAADEFITWEVSATGDFVSEDFDPDLPALGLRFDFPNIVIADDADADNLQVEVSVPEGQFVINDNGTEVFVSNAGNAVLFSAFDNANWSLTQVAPGDSGGYKILFENADGRQTIWNLDSGGALTTKEPLLTEAEVWAAEVTFDADLDGDAQVGVPSNLNVDSDDGTDGVSIQITDPGGQFVIVDGLTQYLVTDENDAPVLFATFDNANWAMTQAAPDPDGTGYKALFQNVDGRVSVWTLDANGKLETKEALTEEADIWAAEVLFNANIDDNAEIGEPTITELPDIVLVTDNGSDDVRLAVTDPENTYVVQDADLGVSVDVTVGGNPISVSAFSNANWTLDQAATNPDGAGYKLLFKNTDGRMTIWTTDAAGERVTAEPVTDVFAAESLFGVDLDGDLNVGTPTNIDLDTDLGADGVTLQKTDPGDQYVVLDGATPIGVTAGGSPVLVTTFANANWTMTQAAPDGSGYKVLFENTDGRKTIWTLDSSGERTGQEVLSGEAAIGAAEVTFQADINGDGEIGLDPVEELPNIVIGSDDGTDDVSLEKTDPEDTYVINDATSGSDVKVDVTLGGNPVNVTTFANAGWSITQAAEGNGGVGYDVLFENVDGRKTIWTLDSAGDRVSATPLTTAPQVTAAETTFGVDLDGDGSVGTPASNIDLLTDDGTDGVSLQKTAETGGEYVVLDGTTAVPVTIAGNGVSVDVFTAANWTMTQAATNPDAAGYKVLFENLDGRITVWTLGASGERLAQEPISGDVAVFETEVLFGVDLNGDNAIGAVEADGDVVLKLTEANEYLVNDGTSNFAVTDLADAAVGVNTDGITTSTALAAEDDPDVTGGFRVLWEQTDDESGVVDDYEIWELDATGKLVAVEAIDTTAELEAAELEFEVDMTDIYTVA